MPAPERSLYCVLLAQAAQLYRAGEYKEAWERYSMLARMTQDHASEITTKRHHAALKLVWLCETSVLDDVLHIMVESVHTESVIEMMQDRRN